MSGEAGVRVIKMTLAYEGTAFAGWQRQPDARTVQDALEQSLAIIEKRPVAIVAAGRTDAGVHARAQVASVAVRNRLPPRVLMRALNVRLPHDLRVTAIEDVPPDFDARRHARAKVYHYTMALGDDPGPFVRRLVWHIPHALDVPAMAAAASLLVGEHDFAAFQATGSDVQTSVRRLLRSSLVDDQGAPALPSVSGDRDRVPPAHGAEHRRDPGRGRPAPVAAGGNSEHPAVALAAAGRSDRAARGPRARAGALLTRSIRGCLAPRGMVPKGRRADRRSPRLPRTGCKIVT